MPGIRLTLAALCVAIIGVGCSKESERKEIIQSLSVAEITTMAGSKSGSNNGI